MRVGTTIETVGQISAKVQFGEFYFTNIMCLVVKSDCPILIGRNIVKHNSIQKTVYYNDRIVFHRKLGQANIEHVVRLILHAPRRTLHAPSSELIIPSQLAVVNADQRYIQQLSLKEKKFDGLKPICVFHSIKISTTRPSWRRWLT